MFGSLTDYIFLTLPHVRNSLFKVLKSSHVYLQNAFKDVARQFAREVIIPQAAELDRSMKFPHAIFDQVWPWLIRLPSLYLQYLPIVLLQFRFGQLL